MGRGQTAAALRERQRTQARDAKVRFGITHEIVVADIRLQQYSNTATEAIVWGHSSNPPETSEPEESNDERPLDEEADQARQARSLFDLSAVEATLEELEVEGDASRAMPTGPSECNTLYEVRSSPGKGLGVFARVDIPQGTRIMADPCLFSVTGPKALLSEIEAAFEALTSEKRKAYMELSCPNYPGRSPVIRIWEANCFSMGTTRGFSYRPLG